MNIVSAPPLDPLLSYPVQSLHRRDTSLGYLIGVMCSIKCGNPPSLPPLPSSSLSLQISPQISPNSNMHVHHILVYQCLSLNETTDVGRGYDCNQATCAETIRGCIYAGPVVTVWAVGGNVHERQPKQLPMSSPSLLCRTSYIQVV